MRCLFTLSISSRDGRAFLAFIRQGAQPAVLKADALYCLAVFISLILHIFLQMWGAFNFRIKVDFLRVVPDPKARLAGASQALLKAACTDADCKAFACCSWPSPCTTSACPSSCKHTECCLQTNRVLVDLFEHIVSWVLPSACCCCPALLRFPLLCFASLPLLPSSPLLLVGPCRVCGGRHFHGWAWTRQVTNLWWSSGAAAEHLWCMHSLTTSDVAAVQKLYLHVIMDCVKDPKTGHFMFKRQEV